jgi:hypothetical protein
MEETHMSSIARERARGTAIVPPAAGRHSASFTVEITVDVRATIRGDAIFSELPQSDGASSMFRLLLGPLSAQAAVLFSWRGNSRPARGMYPISRWEEPSDQVHGLVLLGPVERPLAELHAEAGTLRIIEASDSWLVGSFAFAAIGRPRIREPLRLSLFGWFRARAN